MFRQGLGRNDLALPPFDELEGTGPGIILSHPLFAQFIEDLLGDYPSALVEGADIAQGHRRIHHGEVHPDGEGVQRLD